MTCRMTSTCSDIFGKITPIALTLLIAAGLGACGGGGDDTTNAGNGDGTNPGNTAAPTGSASGLQQNSTPITGGGGGGSSADPSTQPSPVASQAFINKTLERVNAARNSQRLCGTTTMPAQAALTWDTRIEQAALFHSEWMQTNNAFSHEGADGSNPGTRVTNAGYNWNSVAENIAAGQDSIDSVIDAWIDSPGHCRNIMSANVTQIGMALVDGDNSNSYPTYWTMVLARSF